MEGKGTLKGFSLAKAKQFEGWNEQRRQNL